MFVNGCLNLDAVTDPGKYCAEECDGIVRPLAPSDTETEIRLGMNEVKRLVDAGTLVPTRKPNWSRQPQVIFVPCWFWINSPPVCAAGASIWRDGYIKISTMESGRTRDLVRWEARNFYYYEIGRPELAI
jgi:hypothetical protein